MKSLAVWVAALTFISGNLAGSALSSNAGAKGLFFEQMECPTQKMNTGVQFWIELLRDGQAVRANNRTKFKSGDKIRFHVKPNIDGYAYILLRSGSRGEQAQLFPDESKHENNSITAGKEIVLPGDDTLNFDDNPGIEKLTILISRNPIETKAYFNNSNDSSPPTMAILSTGSKDLIPTQILVSYMSPSVLAGPGKSADSKTVKSVAGRGATIVHVQGAESETVKKPVKKNNGARKTASKPMINADNKAKPNMAVEKSADNPDDAQSGVVTVVYKDPNGVLAADISLEHL